MYELFVEIFLSKSKLFAANLQFNRLFKNYAGKEHRSLKLEFIFENTLFSPSPAPLNFP